MGLLYQQVLTILTTPPGNLTYHLVLAFSIAGAFQAAFSQRARRGSSARRRMGFGFFLLLLAQLALGASAGLSQFFPTSPALIPILDRAVAAFSLALIIWLWAFPRPVRLADAATGLLVLLVITLAAFSLVWWSANGGEAPLNGSAPDLVWSAFSLGLLLIGALLLLVRQPDGFSNGLGMITLLFLGHLAHLVVPYPAGDYAGAVRLAQLAAFPLLLTLPQRFPAPAQAEPARPARRAQVYETPAPRLEPHLLLSLLGLPLEKRQEQVCQVLAASLAHAFQADLCLLVTTPDVGGRIPVECAYDLSRGARAELSTLNRTAAPLLASALERGQSLRLLSHSSSPDLVGLGQALELSHAGSLLAAPIPALGSGVPKGIVLLSPSNRRHWTKIDQDQLSQTAASIGGLLQRMRDFDGIETQLDALQEQAAQEHARAERLASLSSTQPVVHSRERAEEPRRSQSAHRGPLVTHLIPGTEDSDKGELRLALEEVAYLRAELEQIKNQPRPAERPGHGRLISEEQGEVIATVAQQLRQPLASTLGYTDLLLSESVGILGALQRKFLERVKDATIRVVGLVEVIIQTVLESEHLELAPEPVALAEVIQQAVLEHSAAVQQRNLALHVDIPEGLPPIHFDRDALLQAVGYLIQNATQATPSAGQIQLHGQLQRGENQRDYVLLQVSDQGGGIPPEERGRLFTRRNRQMEVPIPGTGDNGVGLPIVKTLVEAHGGRVWVDSEMGLGSTYSLILPVSSIAPAVAGLAG